MDFAAVYERHAVLVRRVLSRRGVRAADLDDVAQDAFVAIHRMLPHFEGRSTLETWLHAVSWRVASDYHRRRQARARAACLADGIEDPLLDHQRASAERLHDSLARLEAEQRDLLALREVGGLSIAELAEITGSARATVRERLERARLAVERRLRSHGGIVEPADASALRAAPRVVMDAPAFDYSCGGCDLSCVDATVVALWRSAPTAETRPDASRTAEHALLRRRGAGGLVAGAPFDASTGRSTRSARGDLANAMSASRSPLRARESRRLQLHATSELLLLLFTLARRGEPRT